VKKILIVDDSRAEARLMEAMLASAGYSPLVVNDPRQVEPMADAQRPHLILLDVVMPGRNGFQICRDLRQNPEHHGIPILIVTSKNSDSDRFWAQQQGADGFVTKPFTRESLLLQISNLLAR
jgi:DNA-binding response OmpR family regulator